MIAVLSPLRGFYRIVNDGGAFSETVNYVYHVMKDAVLSATIIIGIGIDPNVKLAGEIGYISSLNLNRHWCKLIETDFYE